MKNFDWNVWPKEKPHKDGKYLVMIGSVSDPRKMLIGTRDYKDKKWTDLELNSEMMQFFWIESN